MSLRARILALGVGSAAAVLVLFAVPVALIFQQAAGTDAEQDGAVAVQAVADYVADGDPARAELSAYVARVAQRSGQTTLTVVGAGTGAIGAERPECAAVAAGTLSGTTLEVPGSDRGDGDRRDTGRAGSRSDGSGEGSAVPAQVSDVDGGRLVSVAGPDPDGALTVCAFVPDATVTEGLTGRLAVLGAAALGVLAVVALVALLLARRLVRDLDEAAGVADRLGRGDLTARYESGGPQEVRRVGSALNRLSGRIEELLVLERETVADLSHRLRTPLTAVRLDVEALPASAAKDELDDHLDQLERTLTAVIRAARRPEREGAVPVADVVEVGRDRFAYWAPLLEDQGRDASLEVDPSAFTREVRCAPEDLAAALDALLENVASHTEDGVAVSVVIAPGNGCVGVEVRDQGPGVPDRAIVRGRSDRGSSGLGLDIARACAEASGGRLTLDRGTPWSAVRLELGVH